MELFEVLFTDAILRRSYSRRFHSFLLDLELVTGWDLLSVLSDGFKMLQGGAPKIAKLVYNSNNYGL